MASGSGKDQDATQDPAHGPLQESNDATAAAAEAISPSPSPPAEDLHERPGEGGGSLSLDAAAEAEAEAEAAAAAAAAADRKGKKVAAPSSPSSAGSNSPPAAPVDSIPLGGGSSFALAVDNRRKATVSWKEPAVGEIVEVPQEPKRIDLKGLFDAMVQEQKAIKDKEEQFPEAEEQEMWQVLQRIGRHKRHSNQNSTRPHVDEWVIPMIGNGMIEHYGLLEKVVGEGVKMNSNALFLSRSSSGFRPVLGDGECFYRSFIFSYLEEILDREDRNEEYRLLAAVKEVSRQHKRLGWTFEFSNRRKMVKKVMRWKRYSGWKHVPTTKSYRKQKLLDFFSGSDATRDIFAFLRLVAAIWICSHREEYEPRVAELREDYTLRDWCFQEVIPEKVYTDHIQMTALVTALGVPLRVENLFQGDGQDLYAGQDPEGNMPRSTCWPHRHRLAFPHLHEMMKSPILWHQKKNSPWCKLKCGLANMVSKVFARRSYSSRWIILATVVIFFVYFPAHADGYRVYNVAEAAALALQSLSDLELAELAAPAAPPPREALGVNWWCLFTAGVCIAWLFAKLSGGQVSMGEEDPDILLTPQVEVDLWMTLVVVVGFVLFLMLIGVCVRRL